MVYPVPKGVAVATDPRLDRALAAYWCAVAESWGRYVDLVMPDEAAAELWHLVATAAFVSPERQALVNLPDPPAALGCSGCIAAEDRIAAFKSLLLGHSRQIDRLLSQRRIMQGVIDGLAARVVALENDERGESWKR